VQGELELGDHTEVAPAASKAPEQLRVLVRAGRYGASVRCHHLERDDVVARETVLAGQPAHPAAERQTPDSGMRHVAGRRGESVRLSGPIERAEQRPTLYPGTTPRHVDPHLAHWREVDHQPVVRHGKAEHAVTTAAHADVQVVIPAITDGRGYVAAVLAPHDHPWPPIYHGVPDGAGPVVSLVCPCQHHARNAVSQGLQVRTMRAGHVRVLRSLSGVPVEG
jgi:hypothetical protein